MATVVKPWNDGGNLSVTYDGNGNGSAILSSDKNNGDARSMVLSYVDSSRKVIVMQTVRQMEGQTSTETYTRLTYIECNGKQYINTGYVVQEDDVIEMFYISTATTSYDKALFGVADSGIGIWATIYSNTGYYRFGSPESVTAANARTRYKVVLKKGSADADGSTASPAYESMPTLPLYLFASNNNGRSVNMYGYCQSIGFRIKASGAVVMDLKPCKRDSDGKVGMIDLVSGKFFASEGAEEFIGGNEVAVTDDYEIIESVSFDNDKVFDTGVYGNEKTYIDVMFRRTDTSGADYMFGCSAGDRMTAYLTTSGYWRYGSGAPTFNTANTRIHYAEVTPGRTTVSDLSRTFTVGDAFTTQHTLPLGGNKPASGTPTKTYQGVIYFFRMRHGSETVVDWYPCRRKSDGVEGFWDCVSQKFIEPI